MTTHPTKAQVIAIMRRLGMHEDKIDQALRELPDVIDTDRDANKLRQLGLGIDIIVDEMGGSAW
jgi:CBS-domain-containing membrane protein